MTTKYVQRGELLDFTATADIFSNDVVAFGVLLAVAVSDIPTGEVGAISVEGVFDLPKKAGGAISAGQPVTWSVADKALIGGTGVAGDLGGGAVAVLPAAAGDTTVRVRLCPGAGKLVAA